MNCNEQGESQEVLDTCRLQFCNCYGIRPSTSVSFASLQVDVASGHTSELEWHSAHSDTLDTSALPRNKSCSSSCKSLGIDTASLGR